MNKSDKTANEVVAEIKIALTSLESAPFVLEGYGDFLFWRGRVAEGDRQIVISSGKREAVDAARILDKENCNKFIVIVDDDFDKFFDQEYGCGNIFSTGTNDLETLVGSTPALHKMLKDSIVESSINIDDLIDKIIKMGVFFGKFRYVNRRFDLGVNFKSKNFSPWKYIDEKNFSLRDDGSVKAELLRLCEGRIGIDDFLGRVDDAPDSPVWNIIQGHDFIDLLRIALSTYSERNSKREEVISRLNLACEWVWLEETSLVREITSWADEHKLTVFSC